MSRSFFAFKGGDYRGCFHSFRGGLDGGDGSAINDVFASVNGWRSVGGEEGDELGDFFGTARAAGAARDEHTFAGELVRFGRNVRVDVHGLFGDEVVKQNLLRQWQEEFLRGFLMDGIFAVAIERSLVVELHRKTNIDRGIDELAGRGVRLPDRE